MSILLLYAAYENLLHNLCRSILDAAARLRAGNRRLRPGLKVFAAFGTLSAATYVTPARIWSGRGLDIIQAITHPRNLTIDSSVFPNDGTNMRRTQIMTFCTLFDLGDPGPILREAWNRLDGIVAERNAIAHGSSTPAEVGRNYTLAEINDLVDIWERRWSDFLQWVENKAATRDFYLLPR